MRSHVLLDVHRIARWLSTADRLLTLPVFSEFQHKMSNFSLPFSISLDTN